MIVNFVGPREPGNHFKKKVAELFKCPVLSFDDLSAALFVDFNEIYQMRNFSIRSQQDFQIMIRERLTYTHPKFYMDWMSQQLVDKVFNKDPSQSRKVQCVILDVETDWEYRVLRTFLLSPKNKKANKVLLVENDNVRYQWFNENNLSYLNWEVDGVISIEEENLEKEVDKLCKSWYVVE